MLRNNKKKKTQIIKVKIKMNSKTMKKIKIMNLMRFNVLIAQRVNLLQYKELMMELPLKTHL